jgi:hypothetical protein
VLASQLRRSNVVANDLDQDAQVLDDPGIRFLREPFLEFGEDPLGGGELPLVELRFEVDDLLVNAVDAE